MVLESIDQGNIKDLIIPSEMPVRVREFDPETVILEETISKIAEYVRGELGDSEGSFLSCSKQFAFSFPSHIQELELAPEKYEMLDEYFYTCLEGDAEGRIYFDHISDYFQLSQHKDIPQAKREDLRENLDRQIDRSAQRVLAEGVDQNHRLLELLVEKRILFPTDQHQIDSYLSQHPDIISMYLKDLQNELRGLSEGAGIGIIHYIYWYARLAFGDHFNVNISDHDWDMMVKLIKEEVDTDGILQISAGLKAMASDKFYVNQEGKIIAENGEKEFIPSIHPEPKEREF